MAEKQTTPVVPPPDWLGRVCIRQARRTDLLEMEWEGEYQRFRRIYRDVFQRTEQGLALMWVAELPGTGVIGQVFVQLNTDFHPELADGKERAYVHAFRVRPAYRNAGLGARLMAMVEEDLLERGFKFVYLMVAQENPGALRLYQRLGYEIHSTDPGRWSFRDDQGLVQHVHEPGWRMRKALKGTDT